MTLFHRYTINMARKKSDQYSNIKANAEKVWLAGLGALAQAEKQGDKLFKTLVKRGKKYEELIPMASDAVKDSVTAAKRQANRTLKDVESAVEKQVKRALKSAGVATKSEVQELKREIARLKKKSGGARSTASKKKKTSAKKKTKTAKKKTTSRSAKKRTTKKTTRR